MSLLYETVRASIDELCRTSFLYVHLEPTNACNTRCVMCPRDAMTRRRTMMADSVLERTVEVLLPPQVPMVSVVGFGEPTLHPRLPAMLRYIRQRRPNIIVKLTTNGSRLTAALIDELYMSGLNLLEISVVGQDPASYAAAMGGLEMATVLEAVEHLNDRGHRYLLTTFPMGHTTPDTLLRYWTSRGARNVEVKGFHRRGGYLQTAGRLGGDGIGGYRPRTPAAAPIARELPVDACHKLYMFLHVNAHGNLVPCVQEINDRNVLANVFEVADFEAVVRLLRSHRPVFDICHGCELQAQDQVDYYARFLLKYFPKELHRLMRPTTPAAVEEAGDP
jgi:Radical SAM superfamily/4Fe-4S single cluster domain